MMSKCPSKAGLCAALTIWLFLSACTLIATTMAYLQPFVHVMMYRHTECKVENIFYITQFICSCGKECKSTYPCFLAHVSVNITSKESWTVILYSDTKQQTIVAEAPTEHRERCSIMVCGDSGESNRQEVAEFQDKYGQKGSIVPCYYDPWDIRAGAVLRRVHPGLAVLHAVLWPAVSLILGLIMCVVFCRRCRQIEHLQGAESKDRNEEEKADSSVLIPLQNRENNVTAANSVPSRQESIVSNASQNQRPTYLSPNGKQPLELKGGKKSDHAAKKRKQMSLRSLWMDVA